MKRHSLSHAYRRASSLKEGAQTVKELFYSHWRGSALGFPRGEAVAAVRR